MGRFDELKRENAEVTAGIIQEAGHFYEIAAEYHRVADIYENPRYTLDNIEKEFDEKTKLNKVDIGFMFFAVALQCIRQYLVTHFDLAKERPGDDEAASRTWGYRETHSSRGICYYDPSFTEILKNPVPFDATFQDEKVKGIFKGTGHFKHRTTLGHDPLLGWVVGTANIATSTLTTWDFKSYHVITGHTKRGDARDKIVEEADSLDVFKHTMRKVLAKEGRFEENSLKGGRLKRSKKEELAGPAIVALSLILEWEHLRSDIDSKTSLPFPIVTEISPELADVFAKYGLDMCNVKKVGEQATYAFLINYIVAVVHRMLYNKSSGLTIDEYEVKTRKILTYSNIIATASNVLAAAVMEGIAVYTGNADLAKKGIKYFDLGGLVVTLLTLIKNKKFIKNVKIEFMEKQWGNIVLGDDYEFMKEEK